MAIYTTDNEPHMLPKARGMAGRPSTLYNGGGTNNALQVDTDTTGIVAGGAAVIDCQNAHFIEIWLQNATAVQNATLCVSEYSAATPTIATAIKATEYSVPDADLATAFDSASVGLTTGTVHYAKAPITVAVTPSCWAMISLQAAEGGTFYARYILIKEPT